MLWVDDYGSVPLRRQDVEWYHRHAGPLSLALEWDDRFPWSFDALKTRSGEDFAVDFLSHHYHPVRWKGSSFPKRIYDWLRMPRWVFLLLRACPIRFSKRSIRISTGMSAAIAPLLIIWAFFLSPPLFVALASVYCLCLVLGGVWYYVQSEKNWEHPILDRAWNEDQLHKVKQEFQKRGLPFPRVVRHGWNLPWQGSMAFYMRELGALADASAVTTAHERMPRISGRQIEWRITQPYYTSLSRDYDSAWDGTDPADRGMLELPVNLGNISAYGFTEESKRIIADAPEGGLVSAYIHPQDDFSAIRELVAYLRAHFDVRFVTALEAAGIYSGQNTR